MSSGIVFKGGSHLLTMASLADLKNWNELCKMWSGSERSIFFA